MKNRETILRRLEKLDGNLSKLNFLLSRDNSSREDFQDVINQSKELIDETKSFIDQEPQTPNELNNY